MVPTSPGYSEISGVPVQYGLYAAAFGLIGVHNVYLAQPIFGAALRQAVEAAEEWIAQRE